MGLSLATIYEGLERDSRDEHRWFRLSRMCGPLEWRFADLVAVAGEPASDRPR